MTPEQLQDRAAWVFDLDGTLTVPVHNFTALRKELGIPNGQMILEYLQTIPEQRAKGVRQRLERIELRLAAQSKAADGTARVLDALHRRGLHLGILTRNSRNNALVSLRAMGMEHLFDPDLVLGRDEAPPKPDPAGIHQLLGHWQVASEQAVMVGDFELDMASGRAAGVGTVLIDSGQRGNIWPDITDLHLPGMVALANMLG